MRNRGRPTTIVRALLVGAIVFAPAIAWASCWDEAGREQGIDPLLLKAIAWQESRGWTNAVGPKLPDGNRAIGLMQINEVHLPTLKKFGIRREHLFDACVSQRVGAWVLADCIHRFGATWKAVGCYNTGPASTNTAAQERYVRSVQRFYQGYRQQAENQAEKQASTPALATSAIGE
ncbi:TPA: lytic transglycosylase domain-containing protein [Burkholderia orbicola]